jgi:hypothetical protein
MAYDLEKYRDKREKVLGVKRRGVSFGALATIVSLVIVLGFGVVVIPKAVAFLNTRNLDDAIYKVQGASAWPAGIVAGVKELPGVRGVTQDESSVRMVITFDRTSTDNNAISAFFKRQGLDVVLLNKVSHHQRSRTIAKERKDASL